MKKLITKVTFTGILISFIIFIIIGCTKEGPQGPPGSNGQDANETCKQCHNLSDTLVTKKFQYEASRHATGSTADQNFNTCAPCHTSQGFIETVTTGSDTTAATISEPAPVNCRTCHNIHTTYTYPDWALRTITPYRLRIDPKTTMDFPADGGAGNLCGRCHQAYKPTPWITDPTGVDSISITYSHWGPHFGQSLIQGAVGAFAFGTPFAWGNIHRTKASCITCHGTNAVGNFTGGHTLWITNETTGDNLTGCNTGTDCHGGSMTSSFMQTKMSVITAKIQTLKDKLIAKNLIDPETNSVVMGKHTQKQMAVVWNYLLIDADGSMGMHNYSYVNDILDKSIVAINETE